MRYLLDTKVISGLMRKRLEIRAHLSLLGPAHDIVTCPIVRGEFLFGIEKLPHGRRREQLAERATAALAEVQCESVPETAGDAYGQIKAARQRQGLALDENDLWIAATAKALGAILVSTDRDFAQIDGLTVEDGPCRHRRVRCRPLLRLQACLQESGRFARTERDSRGLPLRPKPLGFSNSSDEKRTASPCYEIPLFRIQFPLGSPSFNATFLLPACSGSLCRAVAVGPSARTVETEMVEARHDESFDGGIEGFNPSLRGEDAQRCIRRIENFSAFEALDRGDSVLLLECCETGSYFGLERCPLRIG